jgi:hypothetical protein
MSRNLKFELSVPLDSSLYSICSVEMRSKKVAYITVKIEEKVWFLTDQHVTDNHCCKTYMVQTLVCKMEGDSARVLQETQKLFLCHMH